MDDPPKASAREQAMRSRMAQADADAMRSDLAFAAGRFQEYFEEKGHEAEQRIEDRYAEFYGDADLAGGDSGTSSGGGPGDSDATDGGDSSPEPPPERGSPPPR